MDLFICENVPMTELHTAEHMQTLGQQAKKASALMAKASAATKNAALRHLAALLRENTEALQRLAVRFSRFCIVR